MSALPDRPSGSSEHLPARRLTSGEVEAVIRRAVELQAHETEHGVGAGAEGMSEAELMRISGELGLSRQHLQQALAETSVTAPSNEGWFGRGFGPGDVTATRLVRRPVEVVRQEIDTYLRERECMIVARRFPDRTVYGRSTGVAVQFQRISAQMSGRYPLLNARQIEFASRAADEGSSFVSLTVSLRAQRAGAAAGGLAAGGGGGGALAVALGLAVAPPAALIGIPVMLGSVLGMRALYRHTFTRTQGMLESMLDRVEHGDLAPPASPGWRQKLGF